MLDIDNITASQRILAHLHEGRLVQRTWHDEDGGRELACVLGAISPDIVSDTDCPASVMPRWMAPLTVYLFDGQAKADAMTWAGRFGAQMAQWHRLDDAAWFRAWASFCSWCVRDAQRSADSAAAFDKANAADAARWAARADAAAARAAAAVVALDADAYPATAAAVVAAVAFAANDAAAAAAYAAYAAAAYASVVDRQTCWTRMATALCDLIDAEMAALAAKENCK
ncbi:MAG: hypothetical protein INH34_18045 [Phycisphaerales bacterium]|nr:hypothetical protein [Phycisphaerales bacterium]